VSVLITGASGNLGSILARHLVSSGLDLRRMYHCTPIAPDLATAANVTPVRSDLAVPATLVPARQELIPTPTYPNLTAGLSTL
jgi:uncharacterized protein YbjT (DUF2867 family)